MRASYIYLIFITLFISCNSSNTNSSKAASNHDDTPIQNENVDINDSVITQRTKEDSTEIFMHFFHNFMWSESLQKERVKIIDWKYSPFYTNRNRMPLLSYDIEAEFDKEIKEDSVVLSVLSFKNEQSDNYRFVNAYNKWFLTENNVTDLSENPDSDFWSFLITFSKDSVFQKKHIQFPLLNYYADSDNDYETAVDTLKISNWNYIDLEDEIENILTHNNASIDSDSRIFMVRGIETGIYMNFYFKLINDEWILVKIEDLST